MEKLLKGQVSPILVGMAQAVLVAIYCAKVGLFIYFVSDTFPKPGFLGVFLMLVLLVFSAAVTGTLVFGYPAYLALKNKIKEALSVLGYTLLFFFLIILVIIAILIATI